MISHDHKLIFVHIPKCAGRSICDMFQQRFDHYTARCLEKEYQPFFSTYHTMTIVRNPFDRLVALYIYIKNHRRHAYERIAVSEGNIPDFSTWLKINIDNYQGDFAWLSPEGLRGTDGDMGSSFWFSSQRRRISNAEHQVLVKDVFRLEDGTEAIENYLTGITGIKAAVPHCNKSEYDDYRKFYNQTAMDLASSFQPIIEDCKAFNYTF